MKRTLAGLAAIATISLSAITTGAAPASAAIPTCTSFGGYTDAAGYITVVPLDAAQSNFCTLQAGNSGESVRALQQTLNGCYYDGVTRLAEDGDFGPATTKALKRAQQLAGVTADGVYGPNTRDALRWSWSLNWQPRCLRLSAAPQPIR
ncbi:peptidoglycan-binding domain-containing protein [Streptomyces sp. NPDC047017]|uniref:peptidoglycan-binding domain-containing protein n=1 Tax=Streptomyces sp. NPDC047017 TaxID=3155024 RepID=UPI0033E6107A